MLTAEDKLRILEAWSQLRPGQTKEDHYPQVLSMIEAMIVLKLTQEPANGG